MKWGRLFLLLSFSLPLSLILISIAISPWFNIFDNALSDLGHATRSAAAPVFNFGLASGGFLAALISAKYVIEEDGASGTALILAGFFLVLIAVFDEIYGFLHFVVSVAFFIMLAIFLIIYAARYGRRAYVALCLIISMSVWASHFGLGVPKGVAIPEFISFLLFLPFYVDVVLRMLKE